MTRNTRFLIFALFFISFALILTNCGSSGGGGGGGGNKCGGGDCSAPTVSVDGGWSVQETAKDSDCPDKTLYAYGLFVSQNGNSITISDGSESWSGELCGSTVHASGSYYDDNTSGNVSISCMTLNVAADGCSFTGSSKWTWSDGGLTCSGTTQLSGLKGTCQ